MTSVILPDEVDKYCDSDDLEKILALLVKEDGTCRMCGQDHSFKFTP
jgi:hypothetical protein